MLWQLIKSNCYFTIATYFALTHFSICLLHIYLTILSDPSFLYDFGNPSHSETSVAKIRLKHLFLTNLAKWLIVRLRTKRSCVRIPLQSLCTWCKLETSIYRQKGYVKFDLRNNGSLTKAATGGVLLKKGILKNFAKLTG